jgi:methenyltetrahydromethanopterin cyclohydrolase
MNKPLSINRQAWKLLDRLIENPDFYGVKVEETASGTTIVDAGVHVRGGFQAGKIITEICMGGCAKAYLTQQRYENLNLPSIQVYSDQPAIATLASQYAGWRINEEGYSAIGSGPARALAKKPRSIYEQIKYEDDSNKGIIVLETERHPPTKIRERLAEDCHISPKNLAVILTPTTSLAGATQISGRVVETGMHKLARLGLDPCTILHASGCAPIPPIHPKFAKAMARTNDAILYGGSSYYVVEHENDEHLEEIVKKAPSMSSKAYGRPFIEIFKEAKYDFYKIDLDLFAPAAIMVSNAKTGNTFQHGKIDTEALEESFGLKRD